VAAGAGEAGVAGAACDAPGVVGAVCCAQTPTIADGAPTVSAKAKTASLQWAKALKIIPRPCCPNTPDSFPRQYETNAAWRQDAVFAILPDDRLTPAPVLSI
jgi:hypothetical protein